MGESVKYEVLKTAVVDRHPRPTEKGPDPVTWQRHRRWHAKNYLWETSIPRYYFATRQGSTMIGRVRVCLCMRERRREGER
jgi:hypothetical protein